jgi:hypothetical protein
MVQSCVWTTTRPESVSVMLAGHCRR